MNTDIDYRLAFDLAPIGMVLSRNRTMVDCNQRVCEMFDVGREQLIGQTFQLLYPSADEYERTGQRITPILNAKGVYADDRVMKRKEAIIMSMTPKERRKPDLLQASRKRRIAAGAGVTVQEVNRLLNQFEQMQKMMKQMQNGGLAKLMRGFKGMMPGMR